MRGEDEEMNDAEWLQRPASEEGLTLELEVETAASHGSLLLRSKQRARGRPPALRFEETALMANSDY